MKTKASAGEFALLPIGKLKPDPDNPRKITPEALGRLAVSLREHGCVETLCVNRRTGYTVIGGHQRLEALKALGIKTVPCFVVNLEKKRAQALNIALNNRSMQGEYDFTKLAEILAGIDNGDFDVSDLTGFDAEKLQHIAEWAPDPEGGVVQDEIPEPPEKPITKPGDLWLLGTHRLLCGDSTKAADVARLMDGKKAVLMNTDPPYGIAYDSTASKPDGHKRACPWQMVENDDLVDEQIQPFLEAAFRAAKEQALSRRSAWYLWHAHLTGAFFAAAAAAAADVLLHRQIIWVKPRLIIGMGMYHWMHEPCFMGWIRGSKPPFYGPRNQTTIWQFDYDGKGNPVDRVHPTQKPVKLFEAPILNHTKPGEILYEPFSGSGSQIVAAEQLHRKCYAMEIAPPYCDVAVQRWEALTGKKAERVTSRRKKA